MTILARTHSLHRRLRHDLLALLARRRRVAARGRDISRAAAAGGHGFAFFAFADDGAVDVGRGIGADVAGACATRC